MTGREPVFMRLEYFPDTDTALIKFSQREVYETREVTEDIFLDLDREGNLVNMTIEHVKAKAAMEEGEIDLRRD